MPDPLDLHVARLSRFIAGYCGIPGVTPGLIKAAREYSEMLCGHWYSSSIEARWEEEWPRKAGTAHLLAGLFAAAYGHELLLSAIRDAARHDRDCEEEGEGACCYWPWRKVMILAGEANNVTADELERVRHDP